MRHPLIAFFVLSVVQTLPFASSSWGQPPFVDREGRLWFYDRNGNAVPYPRPRPRPTPTRARLAAEILKNPNITLATGHDSQVRDVATARQNIVDTAAGRQARRSHYQNAPGGGIPLQIPMLRGMLALARSYDFRVTEIAGGSHSPGSSHYDGFAFDVGAINGVRVDSNNPDFQSFMALCRRQGAKQVLGPGDRGHDTHIHVSWEAPKRRSQ